MGRRARHGIWVRTMVKANVGAGGIGMQRFLASFILKGFSKKKVGDIGLDELDDGADVDGYVFTIDGHTVQPIFFRGGDIGRLSVCGTVNDLSVMGAKPFALANSFIVQEGFPDGDLERIIASMEQALTEADCALVCGDTKVVEDGIGIFITTAGLGIENGALRNNLGEVRKAREYPSRFIRDAGLRGGDRILFSGTIADHGISLMSLREGLEFETELASDCAPVWDVVKAALDVGGVVAMKDPTRGGVATTLNEMANKSGVGVEIEEEKIPLRREVIAASEMLGLNVFDVANEGKVVMGVMPEFAEDVLEAMRNTKYGKEAAIVGEATDNHTHVLLKTRVGGRRILESPMGDPVPRVC